MLDFLLEYGTDVKSKDGKGNQVLHYLCNSPSSTNLDFRNDEDDEKLVLTLLNHGIKIKATNHNGEWALYLAAVDYNEQLIARSLLNGLRCQSSAELFRSYEVVEGKGKDRPDMQGKIRGMVKLLGLGREKGKREKVPKEA